MMTPEPRKALSGALSDPTLWVRLGAANVAPWLAPSSAAALLTERANALHNSMPVDETAVIAVALARAGGDPRPMVAELLHGDLADLNTALEGDYDGWSDYSNGQIRNNDLKGPFRVLTPFYASWGSREQLAQWRTAPGRESPESQRAHAASGNFRFWENFGSKAQIQNCFAPALEHLNAGRAFEAINPLIKVALTQPDAWLRTIAQQMLIPLGADAAAPLLSTLAGQPHFLPDERIFDSIAQESGERLSAQMTPVRLAAFLAGEALENFRDPETGLAVVNAAIGWSGEQQMRAARVAARMSADVALPPLVWNAMNLPSENERSNATKLLNRIVHSDAALGMRLHHIQSTELNPGQLGWLSDIVSDRLPERGWITDASIGIPVLREAVRSMPDIVGNAGYVYSEPPTARRVSNFSHSMFALKGLFGGELPATTLPRYPHSTFPAFCRIGVDETLSVQLLLEKTIDTAPAIDVAYPKGVTDVELLVLVQAPGFAVALDSKTIRVSRDKPSDVAAFVLTPRNLGQQAIDIKFMMGPQTVGHCVVITEVTADRRGDQAQTIALDPVGDFLPLQGAAQAVLRVKSRPDGMLEWELLKNGTDLQPLGTSPNRFGPKEASGWVEQQGPLIRQMLETELSQPDMAAVLAQLSALGYALLAQIAPLTLAEQLDALQESALLVIDSDADWIPWELLASRPVDPLWGDRFVLIRAPVMTKPPNAAIARPAALSTTLERALLVVGDEIERPNSVAEQTFRGMAQRAEPLLHKADWLALCAAVANKDIVHFACHGRSTPAYHLSYKEGIGGHLFPAQAHALGLKWGAVVFANACSSGATQLLLADFQSFGREFYYAGARPFIGTLGPVPEREAIEFASLFYEQFAFAGLPAGQAMRRARQESRNRFKRPIWLFYSLYGNPSVVRRWSAT
jgi:CHAT domain